MYSKMSRLVGLSCCKVRCHQEREPLQEKIRKNQNKKHPSSEPTPVSLQANRKNINNGEKEKKATDGGRVKEENKKQELATGLLLSPSKDHMSRSKIISSSSRDRVWELQSTSAQGNHCLSAS
jgi:hypothetical protein